MTSTVDSILENALRLSSESRLKIAERLIESVGPDEALFAALVEEACERDAAMDAGVSAGLPLDEALRSVRQSVQQMPI
jgi:hypothetical protein